MTNHRVVLDTNVLISAILFGGKPGQILTEVIVGRIDCVLSLEILDELGAVLHYVPNSVLPRTSVCMSLRNYTRFVK